MHRFSRKYNLSVAAFTNDICDMINKLIFSMVSINMLIGLQVSGLIGCVNNTNRLDSLQCIDEIELPLINGSRSGSFLAVSVERSQAIGRVWPSHAPRGYFCTGVFIGEGWVLTAGHCLHGTDFVFETGSISNRQPYLFSSISVQKHPIYDALLIRLDGEVPVDPIHIVKNEIDSFWEGERIQLAGYGSTEEGVPSETVMFLVSSISEITPTHIVVDGAGRSGACIGDSGGPLLERDRDGELVLAGILSKGSASCKGKDKYIRGDILHEWINLYVGEQTKRVEACGALTETGMCRRGSAIWCASNKVIADLCENREVCGFSNEAFGYRCIKPESDTCEGIGRLGVCEQGYRRRCDFGTIDSLDCEACGLSCSFSPKTGRAICEQGGSGS